MKILITWRSSAKGGAESSVTDLCRYLTKHGHTVILLYSSTQKQDLRLTNTSIKVHQFIVPTYLYKPFSFLSTLFCCLIYQPNIANINYRATLLESIAAKNTGAKVITTVRAILFDRKDAEEFKYCDAVVGISDAVITQLKKLGFKGKTCTIYNGINLEQFDTFLQSRPDKNNIYSMCRLVKWKRIDMFIRACIKVKKRLPKIQVYIFGEGPEQKALDVLINANNASSYIHLKSWISNNDPVLHKMGIFVMSSLAEPFGKTTIEAILRQKEVIAADSGGSSELIPNKSLLYKSESIDDLVQKITKAYNMFNSNKIKRQSIAQEYKEYYNLDRVALEYITLYEKLLQNL